MDIFGEQNIKLKGLENGDYCTPILPSCALLEVHLGRPKRLQSAPSRPKLAHVPHSCNASPCPARCRQTPAELITQFSLSHRHWQQRDPAQHRSEPRRIRCPSAKKRTTARQGVSGWSSAKSDVQLFVSGDAGAEGSSAARDPGDGGRSSHAVVAAVRGQEYSEGLE